jgi:CRP-like cAMP-binding protein
MALLDMIGDIPMLKNFTDKEKKVFAEMDHSALAFNKGDVIIKEGDKFASLYLLIRGVAVVTKSGFDNPVALLKQGTIFGEVSFLTKRPRQNSVIAKENVLVLKMDEKFLNKVTPEIRDKIKNYLIELLANRLDTMNEALVKISRYARGSTLI